MMSSYEQLLQQASKLAEQYEIPAARVAALQAAVNDLPGPAQYRGGYLAGWVSALLADVAAVHREDCRLDECRTCNGLAEAVAVNLANARIFVDEELRSMLGRRPWWQAWRR
jgi:hypothetical protein